MSYLMAVVKWSHPPSMVVQLIELSMSATKVDDDGGGQEGQMHGTATKCLSFQFHHLVLV
jgi:hypothetical protein